MDRKRFLVSIFTIAGIIAFSFTFYRAVYYAPSDEIPLGDEVVKSEIEKPTKPTKLEIPKIQVDAMIEAVGITRRGNMAAPASYTRVGWYKYGALPGEVGSAVLDGHLDNGLALPGVFSRLGDLLEGDDIFVTLENGDKLHYQVTERAVYDFNKKVDEVFTESDKRLLRLITCTGTWIAQYRTHDQRLVVTATLTNDIVE
jgi:sortase A